MIRRIELDFPDWTLEYKQGAWYADRRLSLTATHTIVGFTLTEMYEKLHRHSPVYSSSIVRR